MHSFHDCLKLIVEQVHERLSDDVLSLEDLNLAAVILLNVKEREKMELDEVFTPH